MDSVLIVFYSYTGVSRRVAHLLGAQRGWPLGEIVEEQGRGGATGTVRCVLDSLLRRQPAVRYQGPEPSDFRTVVLVSPVWAYRLNGPMRSFIAGHSARLHRVAVLSTMGSRGAGNAVAEIEKLLGKPPILAAAFTQREVEDGSCAQRLDAFGEALCPGRTPQQPVRPAELSPSAP